MTETHSEQPIENPKEGDYERPIGPPVPEEMRGQFYKDLEPAEFIGASLPQVPEEPKEAPAIVQILDPDKPYMERILRPDQNIAVIRTRQVQTIIEPYVQQTPQEFLDEKPPLSIGIDGYIKGAPWIDPYRAMVNINHHEEVNRIATAASCMQAFDLIRIGLPARFRKAGKLCARLHVNDCDEDVCMTHYVFHRHGIVLKDRGTDNSRLLELVKHEDRLDRTGGGYTLSPKRAITQKIAWIFEPYREARLAGEINHLTTAEKMSDIILDVSSRIDDFVHGNAKRIKLDTTYHNIAHGDGYQIIKETGAYARTGIFAADNLQAVITTDFVEDGSYKYAVAKLPFSTFPIEKFFERLNEVEGLPAANDPDGANMWGPIVYNAYGMSVLNGGSPRQTGSTLNPLQIKEIADEVIAEERAKYGF